MNVIQSEKKFLGFTQTKRRLQGWRRLVHLLVSLAFFLPSLLLAYLWSTPGLRIRWLAMWMGFKHFTKRGSFDELYRLVVTPLDSVRYFEFDFMLKSRPKGNVAHCLDVSSPRLLSACWHQIWA